MAERTDLAAADEAALIAAARAGDSYAFGLLYRAHWQSAVEAATRLCGSRADAEDVTATAFERVRAALLHGHGPTVSFRGYLMRAVRSVFLDDRAREQSRCTALTSDSLILDGRVEPYDLQEFSHELIEAMATLPTEQRNAILLRFGEGWSIPEVRAALGSPSDNAVSAVIARAHHRLRAAYRNGLGQST